MTRRARDDADVGVLPRSAVAQGLAAKVAFLRRPGSYPEPTTSVDTIEAHMSWVFLTDEHAYKLKKPFRRNGIDYSTPAMRLLSCRRELRLNRRLAPEVYLGVVPLTADAAGHIAIAGNDEPVDWLVRMRRLPVALSLDHCLAGDTVGAHEARRIVGRLVPFFAAAAQASITSRAYRRRLWNAIADAAAELVRPAFGLMPAEIAAFAAALSTFVADHGDLLDARVRAGRIVEGHGDLRPEHIYLTEPPTIMDCIEFDRSLRLRDPVDELAFLAMECERSGRPEIDSWLFTAYRELAGDDPPRALIEYYKAHNAFVRARIAIWHLDDPDTGPPQHWVDCANDYLDHTRQHLARLRQQLEAGPNEAGPNEAGSNQAGSNRATSAEARRVPRGSADSHELPGLRPAPRAPR